MAENNIEMQTEEKKNRKIKTRSVILMALPIAILILIAWVYFSVNTGPKILYQNWHSVVWDEDVVCSVNIDGSWNRQLTHDYEFASSYGASYSPNGKKIVYGYNDQIKIMNSNGLFDKKLDTGERPSFSPDGESVIYIKDDTVLCMIDIDGKNRRDLIDLFAVIYGDSGNVGSREEIIDANPGHIYSPEFTTDGQKILFEVDYTQKDISEIYVFDMSTNVLTLLAHFENDSSSDLFYYISPDRDRVYYNDENIYTVDVDGMNRSVLEDTDFEFFFLSPDGEVLYYLQSIDKNDRNSLWRLCSIRTDGSGRTVLANDCAPDVAFDLSEDGKMLSFLVDRNNENSTLMIMNVDGTDRRQVVTIEAVGGPGSHMSHVDFTPDNEKLVLSVWKDTESLGTTDLYAIDINGGKLVQLTHMDPDQNAYVIEFSPKGW